MPERFDARHLSTTRDYQPQMTNWFEIQVEGIDALTFTVQDCTLPELSTPPVSLPYGNSVSKVPGQAEWGSGSFTFIDAIMADVEVALYEWQSEVYDPATGKMGWVDQYKRDVIVTQFGPDGTAERPWRFEGCWPSSIPYGSLSMDGSDKKLIECTIEYDRAYRDN